MARRSFRYYVKTGNGAVKIRKPGASVLREFREQALEMTMFNVGEGEAILLRVGNDVVLVDGGAVVKKGNVALGQALRGYLTDRGLKLMAILASHGHVDHLNALGSFLANDASEVWAPEAVYYHNGETLGPWLTDTLQARLNALGPEVITQVPVEGFGQFPGPGGTTITMFTDGRWKPRPAYKSIVASLPYRDARILLTGDIYFDYEDALVDDPATAPHLVTDVLKITRHGSEHGTGANFLEQAAPLISIASTAEDAGHRLERVVKTRLKPFGAVFDTFGLGRHITVRTDGLQRLLRGNQGVLFEVELSLPDMLGS